MPKAENIAVDVKASVPDSLTITDVELSILVGNLLDNAIESCRLSSGKRFIRIYMSMKGKMLYFSMLNSAGMKKKKIGTLFSSNKEGTHGFGLHRAETIIEEHSKFNEIVQDKTAIYISHRLSSCRFCDVIAVFDGGQIVQRGVHDRLLQDTHGKYYELWNAQAQYYT